MPYLDKSFACYHAPEPMRLDGLVAMMKKAGPTHQTEDEGFRLWTTEVRVTELTSNKCQDFVSQEEDGRHSSGVVINIRDRMFALFRHVFAQFRQTVGDKNETIRHC